MFKISADFSLNFVFSCHWVGKTLLYTTENHLHYYADGETETLFSFHTPRGVISQVLADRIAIASIEEGKLKVTTRGVSLLEPIMMGYIETPNMDLIEKLMKNLDSTLVSPKLIRKLCRKGLYYTAWQFVSNINCP